MSHIYLYNPDVKNETKGYEYLDLALEKTENPTVKFAMISKLLEDKTILDKFVSCKRIYKLIKDLHEHNDIRYWYYLGYQKYTIGKFDQALLLFSFGALTGHKDSIRAAAYMWKNSEISFKCRLGHRSLCAFVYYMQLFFFNDNQAGIEAGRLLTQIPEIAKYSPNISEDAVTVSRKLSLSLFDYLASKNIEAKFNKAYVIASQKLGDLDDALTIWDTMITDAWNGDIDFKNLMPAVIAKYYYFLFDKYGLY